MEPIVKKLITDAELPSSSVDAELPSSSVDAVVSNNDLLTEILLRLPVISIILFKIISKRWLSLIKNPNFILRRRQILKLDTPSGIFLPLPNYSPGYNFIRLDFRIPAKRSPLPTASSIYSFDPLNIDFLQSCNGLLLCRINSHKYYVYNPSINLFKRLPQPHAVNSVTLMGFSFRIAFDPTKSPHYKIVRVGGVKGHNFIQIQTYTSETGNWSVYAGDQFPIKSFEGFDDHGIYWNDSIHWLNIFNGALHFKLDVDHLVLTSIQTPGILNGKLHCDRKLYESRGCLLLGCTVYEEYTRSRQMNIYEMSNWYSGWSMKYILNLDEIMILFPKTWRLPTVHCIVVGEREEDSYLVMEFLGEVLQYKIVVKSLHKFYYLGSTSCIYSFPRSFQFIASFADV